jgi:UDP-N-acetylmuramoyl-tripeptide--D-alanyl-D-alanine ligase
MPLWTLSEILVATKGVALACAGAEFDGVSIDSRDIGTNDLFVAIAGDRFDGHDFVEKALANGAGAALVGAEWATTAPKNLSLIIVDDPLIGLEKLAVAARARTKARIVAVTGSVGKTSTKEAIRLVLAAQGRTHASIKSFNNHWGVPLMLARMPADAQFGVFEVGMNHANEIRPLVKMIRPHAVVVTNVGAAHLEHFDDLVGIAMAKAEIFEGLEPGGVAILGTDHDHLDVLQRVATDLNVSNVTTFGVFPGADYCVDEVQNVDHGLRCKVKTEATEYELYVPQFGEHALLNGTAAIAVGHAFNIDVNQSIDALADFAAPRGRGEIIELDLVAGGRATLLDESYNANPISMRAALKIMHTIPTTGKKIGVLGDMLELGESAAELHQDLAQSVLRSGIIVLYLVGPHMVGLANKLAGKLDILHFEATDELADLLSEALAPGDVVMVKGSNGIGLGLIVEELRARHS